jgi:hypothetical protein
MLPYLLLIVSVLFGWVPLVVFWLVQREKRRRP